MFSARRPELNPVLWELILLTVGTAGFEPATP